MFLLSICDSEPRLDTMPVLKTTYYPWTEDSFRPLCYARAAVLRQKGVLFDFEAFERDPFTDGGGEVLDESCAALSFNFFPEREGGVITIAASSALRYAVWLNGEPLPDVTLSMTRYGGQDEQGWYWGVRFVVPNELLERVYGCADIAQDHLLCGNIFKLRRTGAGAHLGAVAPMKEPFIFSPENLAEFKAVAY